MTATTARTHDSLVTDGPFVMNTEAEIVEAIEDFDAGKFGPVPTDAVTDPRARAR